MLRLYHAPQTRSTRIRWLLEELGARDDVDLKLVSIARPDGSTQRDPENPHPEGKVPVLQHDGALIMESGAIVQYLTELYPAAGLGREAGHPERGAYLTWLHYFGGVIEPVLASTFSKTEPDALFFHTFRGFSEMSDRLDRALTKNPYLLGNAFSAADLLISTPFIWFPSMMPDTPAVRDWVARCGARPGFAKVTDEDLAFMNAQAVAANG